MKLNLNNYLIHLIDELLALGGETEWIEYKVNFFEPEKVGEYLSALSNAAALHNKEKAYVVWGVEDSTLQVVGTEFDPKNRKVNNQELISWLLNHLNPKIDFQIFEFIYNEKKLVIFEIPAATISPVSFKGRHYIRTGSYTKLLDDFPEKARKLWRKFESYHFETELALKDLSIREILSLLNTESYFSLLKLPYPDNEKAILSRLIDEKLIIHSLNTYSITNLGAILFAKDFKQFPTIAYKGLRVIFYNGPSKLSTLFEKEWQVGYANGFEDIMTHLHDRLLSNEELTLALRQEHRMYPDVAIRELVANTLIHQDFTIRGAAARVEVFSDRIEFTNPGAPLIDTLRFIDKPCRARNDAIASLMRRLGICEERGSGIDKVITAVEMFQLPAPRFKAIDDNTVVTLYAKQPYSKMGTAERIQACYQHACLRFVLNKEMTNASLRARLAIDDSNYTMASKLINATITTGLIKPKDVKMKAKKHISYVPFWA